MKPVKRAVYLGLLDRMMRLTSYFDLMDHMKHAYDGTTRPPTVSDRVWYHLDAACQVDHWVGRLVQEQIEDRRPK